MTGPHGLWIGFAAVLLALMIDQWIGEPPPRWHPVVWMGNYLGRAGRWLQAHVRLQGADWPSFWRGALAWWGGVLLVLVLAGALQWLLLQLPWGWAALLLGIALKPLLAWRMLTDEVAAVEAALGRSLEEGQQQLARIVSRDVTQLNEEQVRESAIESLSENLNDSVIAPLFWFALLGLPGAALFRYADTADSMWGYRGDYRGQVWEWAGKWAARIDDVLAWVPARITGLALLLSGMRPTRCSLQRLQQEAAQTPSPNSGWPMAAMAMVLDVRLRKPGVYTLHAAGQAAQAGHVPRAVQMTRVAVLGLLGLTILFAALAAFGWQGRAA